MRYRTFRAILNIKVVVLMLNPNIQNQIVTIIQSKLPVHFIIVFGSYAKGNEREDSDLDIALFSEHEIPAYERFILAGELASALGIEVDLIDIRQIDTVFTMQIFSQGVPIYIEDLNQFYIQRMRAYSMYFAFNEQRAPVIQSIKERGSVFGYE